MNKRTEEWIDRIYDNLVEQLGGRSSPAIGFAFGLERILLVRQDKPKNRAGKLIYIITLGEEADRKGALLLHTLRSNQILSEMDYVQRSLKAKMRRANELGASFCIIIGEAELNKNIVILKNMASGEQKEVPEAELLNQLQC